MSLGFRVEGSGFSCLGFRVQGLGFSCLPFGLREAQVSGLGPAGSSPKYSTDQQPEAGTSSVHLFRV